MSIVLGILHCDSQLQCLVLLNMYVSVIVVIIAIMIPHRLVRTLTTTGIRSKRQTCRFLSSTSETLPDPIESETSSAFEQFDYRKNEVKRGHVYFVATPIGNLGDMSLRARSILEHVDVICAEDTRQTSQLLRLLSIPFSNSRTLLSHHEHNQRQSIDEILRKTREGKSVAVVSDAGTPGISDPGSPLAAVLARENIPLHAIPGPSAAIAALSVSGFPCQPFTFLGFLPVKGKGRREAIEAMRSSLATHTIVLYEAPHRIISTFESLAESSEEMSRRAVVCCRELTKKFEEIRRGTVRDILQQLQLQEPNQTIKRLEARGEFTIVLGPMEVVALRSSEDWKTLASKVRRDHRRERDEGRENKRESEAIVAENGLPDKPLSSDDELVADILRSLEEAKDRGLSRRDAVREVASQRKVPRNIVYPLSLKLSW